MLRVGLTGNLGSGKSTVARMLAERGAVVLSSDEMGRALMQPGQAVYAAIVERFGAEGVAADGMLDRSKLAMLAFDRVRPRVEDLNALVHPAVIATQTKAMDEIAAKDPKAIVVVESALIFSTKYGSTDQSSGSWRERFDRILLVTAPEEQEVERFVDRAAAGRTLGAEERSALEADARQRLAVQQKGQYAGDCLVLHNDGDIEQLEAQVDAVWSELTA